MTNLRVGVTLILCLCGIIWCKPVQEQDTPDEFDVETGKPHKKPKEAPSFETILKANEAVQSFLFEGDILGYAPKNAIQGTNQRWPDGVVPYVIDSLFDYQTRNMMIESFQELSVRTCLTFVERTNEEDYLSYEIDSGCYSYVGRVGGKQLVSLGGGCQYHRTVLHETLHAVGFYHEHSRPDRDDYIEIVWDVVQDGKESSFQKYAEGSMNLLGMSYDYDSVMHYTDTSYSKNGSKTIIALFEGGENMGKLDYLSKVDIAEINALYEGKEKLAETGYTDWTAWSVCDVNCERHRKRYCDGESCVNWGEIQTESTGCDVECIVGLDPECPPTTYETLIGTLNSPLYPRQYKNDVTCRHTIEAPEGGIVTLRFSAFALEDYFDNVYIYDGQDESAPKIGSYTGHTIPPDVISTDQYLTVVFQADYAIIDAGYAADYTISYPIDHSCAFESSPDYCGWKSDSTGGMGFIWNSGQTSSSLTGPTADHTSGDDAGHYLYIETSRGADGDYAVLRSPEFPQAPSVCFSIWYHMYGQDIGTLNVYLMVNGVKDSSPFISYSGDKGDIWFQASGTIKPADVFQIEIQAFKETSYRGDIAIDDVALKSGPCDLQ